MNTQNNDIAPDITLDAGDKLLLTMIADIAKHITTTLSVNATKLAENNISLLEIGYMFGTMISGINYQVALANADTSGKPLTEKEMIEGSANILEFFTKGYNGNLDELIAHLRKQNKSEPTVVKVEKIASDITLVDNSADTLH